MKTCCTSKSKPEYGCLARHKKDYARWHMAREARSMWDKCAEVHWRCCRMREAVDSELSLTVEWLKAAGQIERESDCTHMKGE